LQETFKTTTKYTFFVERKTEIVEKFVWIMLWTVLERFESLRELLLMWSHACT